MHIHRAIFYIKKCLSHIPTAGELKRLCGAVTHLKVPVSMSSRSCFFAAAKFTKKERPKYGTPPCPGHG